MPTTSTMTTKALLVFTVAAAVLGTALGVSYTVGAPGGSWDLKTNYTQWAFNIKFVTGDQLVFQYSGAEHDVVEVSKAGYDSCSASGPVASFQTGNDVVQLATAGRRYFICGVPGHCAAGMKLEVDVRSTQLRCRGRGIRRRCQRDTPLSSAAASVGTESMVGRLGLGAVAAAGLVMLFY